MQSEVLRSQNQQLLKKLQSGQSTCKSLIGDIKSYPKSTGEQSSSHPYTCTSISSRELENPIVRYDYRDQPREYTRASNVHPCGSPKTRKKLEMGIQDHKIGVEDSHMKLRRESLTNEDLPKYSIDLYGLDTDDTEQKTLATDRTNPLLSRVTTFDPREYNQMHNKENVGLDTSHSTMISEVGSSTYSNRHRPMPIPRTETRSPKSILKRRKIIDDNVKVESQYDHTPAGSPNPDSRGLNFSYSDVGEFDDGDTGSYRSSIGMDVSYADSNRSSLLPDNHLTMPMYAQKLVKRDTLLRDSGNDRKNAAVVKSLYERPQVTGTVLDDYFPEGHIKPLPGSRSTSLTKSHLSDNQNLSNTRTSTLSASMMARSHMEPTKNQQLLGYDWIAGIIDNEADGNIDQSDTFYEDLKEFRRVNKADCEGRKPLELVLDLSTPLSPVISKPEHTCIHGFTVNKRLYPEPMNANEDGTSVCPVCLVERNNEPTGLHPGYVRVSIPRSTLSAPHRVQPHRRRSFDETDSFALSKHCLAGWETSQPTHMPTASSLDLKHAARGIKGKMSTTVSACDDEANSFSRHGSSVGDNLIQQTRKRLNDTIAQLNRTTLDSSQSSQMNATGLVRSVRDLTSEELLSKTHNFRFSQQRFEKDREIKTVNGGLAGVYSLT